MVRNSELRTTHTNLMSDHTSNHGHIGPYLRTLRGRYVRGKRRTMSAMQSWLVNPIMMIPTTMAYHSVGPLLPALIGAGIREPTLFPALVNSVSVSWIHDYLIAEGLILQIVLLCQVIKVELSGKDPYK